MFHLPPNVEVCSGGERCCWRWLSHAVLKEVSYLRSDLDAARHEYSTYVSEHARMLHDSEAYAMLRGAHGELQRELGETRADAHSLRREIGALRSAFGQQQAREQELERELNASNAERKEALQRIRVAEQLAEDTELELVRTRMQLDETRRKLLQVEDQKARALADLNQLRADHDAIQRAAFEAAEAKAKQLRPQPGLGPGRPMQRVSLPSRPLPGALIGVAVKSK